MIYLVQTIFSKSSAARTFVNSVTIHRFLSQNSSKMKGLVLGAYTESGKTCNEISSYTTSFNEINNLTDGKLSNLLKGTGPFQKSVKQKLLWIPMLKKENIDFDCVSIVDLGSKEEKKNSQENLDEKSENVRRAVASGIKALKAASEFDDIFVDPCDSPQSAAESANLSVYSFVKPDSTVPLPVIRVSLYKHKNIDSKCVSDFERGSVLAACQNFQTTLMETPANYMTPSMFSNTVQDKLKDSGVKVVIRDEEWAESMKMNSFLSVGRGSDEKSKFLELHYDGANNSDKCIALVGKGITFDTGGISLKPPKDMDAMRADMGGAACVASTILAASRLKLKVNLKAFIPLAENMPSGRATKPGDVVVAMNGKTIQVDNTDAEGRLVLCDGLCYAQQFKPMLVIDIATLTGAIMIALGEGAAGAYCNDDRLWEILNKAQYATGDRVWRMPLFKHYVSQMTKNAVTADINNIGGAGTGGSCTAAAFLSEFIEADTKWIHLDIAGVMTNKTGVPYLWKGMSGRPLRTVVEFIRQLESEF